MKRKTIYLVLCICLIGLVRLTAQNTGHFGKKFLLKTTIINGRDKPFNGAEIEYALSRKMSLILSYNTFEYSRGEKGVRTKTGVLETPRGDFNKVKEISVLKNGTTSGNYFGIGFKKYFNAVVPAPYGLYVQFYAGFGKCTYTDYTVSYIFKEKILNEVSKIIKRPDETGLSGESKVFVGEIPSLGYQRIFARLIALDVRAGLLLQYCTLPDNLANNMENNYFVRSNTVSYAFGRLNMGPTVQVKLGLLLF